MAMRRPDRPPPESMARWIVTSFACAGVLIFGAMAASVAPKFAATFKDLHGELPWTTTAVVSTPPLAWILGALVAAAILVLKSLLLSPRAALVADCVVLLVLLGCFAAFVAVLFHPLLDITDRLGRSGAG